MEDFLIQYDIYFVGAVLALTLAYLYTIGRDFGVVINVSLYMAIATMLFVPFLRELPFEVVSAPVWLTKIGFFFFLIVSFAYLQMHNGYFEPQTVPSSWEVPIFAVIFAGMFTMVSIGFLPEEVSGSFSPLVQKLFLQEPIANLWFLGTPLALLLIKGRA